MVAVRWKDLHWKDFCDQNTFDPRVVLDELGAAMTEDQARYVYSLACVTRSSGVVIALDTDDPAPLLMLAHAARTWNGQIVVAGTQQRPNSESAHPVMRWASQYGVRQNIDYRDLVRSKPEAGTIDMLFLSHFIGSAENFRRLGDFKLAVRVGGVILFDEAEDAGEVDVAIDKMLSEDKRFIEIQSVERLRAFRRHSGSLPMILCAGLQSGGTTLVSWCFLQRRDTDGILDMYGDRIELMPYINSSIGWCKMTVASFRWQDVADFYAEIGWTVKPLLVVRDVRAAYASLRKKFWAINGLTAEDTPFQIRFRRFLRDWELFRSKGWPIIRFESLLEQPEATLRNCCKELGLSWSDDMITWPKNPEDVSGLHVANETFKTSLKPGGWKQSVITDKKTEPRSLQIPAEDMRWLQKTFREFNKVNGYPVELSPGDPNAPKDRPTFTTTDSYRRTIERNHLWRVIEQCQGELAQCQSELARVLNSRSWRFTSPLRKLYEIRHR